MEPHIGVKKAGCSFVQPTVAHRIEGPWSAEAPFISRVISAKYLTTPDSIKQTGFLELEIPVSLAFEAGDAFGMLCHNSPKLVSTLLALFPDENADAEFHYLPPSPAFVLPRHLHGALSLRYAISHRCDLTMLPSKALIKELSNYAPPEIAARMRDLTSVQRRDDWKREIEERSPDIVELLVKFSVKIPPHNLLLLLPPLQPRFYSAANSLLAHPSRLHIAFTVFDVELSEGRRRQGVCSSMLAQIIADLSQPSLASLSLNEPSQGSATASAPSLYLFPRIQGIPFRLPSLHLIALSVPLILIGPGTGVAPFRGFLQHLKALQDKDKDLKLGPVWLFFGCRFAARDQLFKEEMEDFVKCGVLTRYVVAYSRETDEVSYVQHKIEEHGAAVLELMLKQGAYMYICGDARAMAKSVLDKIRSLLSTVFNEKEALERRTAWQKEKRLLIDAW